MANGKTHMLVGGGIVVALYCVDKKLIRNENLTIEGVLGSLFLGMVGGALADLLDPPTSPNHRQFFHSMVCIGIMLFGREKLFDALNLDNNGRKCLDWFIASYGSHLALDLCTPKGLPII